MENQKTDNTGAPGVESLVKRGFLFLEDSDWKKADEYFDRALDINPEYAPAYIGKLCTELLVRKEESLGNYKELRQGKQINKPLGEYSHFQKALRFADAAYKEKLNAYEQKIKASFPKTIPQMFTDEYINGEIEKLDKEIKDLDAGISWGNQTIDRLRTNLWNATKFKKDWAEEGFKVTRFAHALGGGSWEELEDDATYKERCKDEEKAKEELNKKQNDVQQMTARWMESTSKKQMLEPLVGLSFLDRMDGYYNPLVEAMQREATEDEYKNLAKQFLVLEGYENSNQLADQCGKLAIKARYKKLVQEKAEASAEDEYKNLAKQFRTIGSYEKSAELADECDKLADECSKQKELKKKARYAELVQAKGKASSESEYKQFAKEFREMGNYENAAQLADECSSQASVLQKQREEREGQEQARKAAIKAEMRAEEKKRDLIREKQQRRNEFQKKSFTIFLKIAPVLAVLIASYSLLDDDKKFAAIAVFLLSFALVHFRWPLKQVLEVLSNILKFAATFLIIACGGGFFMVVEGGTFAMVVTAVALILAYIFPAGGKPEW